MLRKVNRCIFNTDYYQKKRTIVENDGPFLRPGMMPEFSPLESTSHFLYYYINEMEHIHTFGINIIRLNLNQIRIMLISLV